ncbi:hypothetical protein L6452_18232 [Arctium lappa]|uniref:Uncharacterized protein n=1 Tax=Arctium lappa TaxID=4217 RepID=A0ACB9C5H5_ARCLA|nr:hypothetical protein L6452_18232 [Arctium lappa]
MNIIGLGQALVILCLLYLVVPRKAFPDFLLNAWRSYDPSKQNPVPLQIYYFYLAGVDASDDTEERNGARGRGRTMLCWSLLKSLTETLDPDGGGRGEVAMVDERWLSDLLSVRSSTLRGVKGAMG